MSLSLKQQKFIEEYLLSGNASDAARKAGYSEKTANEQGSRLLANVSIAAAIKKHQEERKVQYKVDEEMIMKSLMEIAFFDPLDVIELKGNSWIFKKNIKQIKGANFTIYPEYQTKDDKKKGITRAKLSVQSGDRKGALELLGQQIGMWKGKNVPDGSSDSDSGETALQRIQRIIRERAERLGQKKPDTGEGGN